MTILELWQKLGDAASENPNGMEAEVVLWLRSRETIEHAVLLDITDVEIGYRDSLGGPIACICATLDTDNNVNEQLPLTK
jgi:hypothetical protein